MIVSTFERRLFEDWLKYAESRVAEKMLDDLRKETKITNGFGVIWKMDLPDWAARARNGDFSGVKCIRKKAEVA
ncbi:hypothetical protein IKG16_01870 [Candidatus Saccharibacteria bacterium]|nr:hypothetical protein [Candidatus Saccharibacteria bacterium]